MKLRYASLLVALTLAVGACGDDGPTGNNDLDPTLALNPCDSLKSGVAPNGFVMSGSGYQGRLVNITDPLRSLQFDENGDTANPDAAVTFTMLDTIALPEDAGAQVIVDIHLPKSNPDAFPVVYAFNNETGDAASSLRIALYRRGTAAKVYRSVEGHFTLDSVIQGAQVYGRFCGTLQDSLSRARLAIMGGRFSTAE